MNELNNQNMLQVGTILHGTYKIESYLASGGFGNTYLAKNIEFDETYAIKEFFVKGVCQRDDNSTTISVSNAENTNSFEQQREKFKKEARRLRSLSNPHIVKVYDLFEENGTAYYVMDYVDGENLSARLKRTNAPLAESDVRNYLNQILDGLEAIHNEGMFHLDIKPANIMVDSHDVVKLIDFGASKQQSTVGGATMSTGISYTNGYAPSEQMAQSYDKFGPWTDCYALGATVYKLLTNQEPPSVSDLSEDETEDKHLALPMPNVSEKMKTLVVWMMQVNRLKRPQSVEDVKSVCKLHKKKAKTKKSNQSVKTLKTQNVEETISLQEKKQAQYLRLSEGNLYFMASGSEKCKIITVDSDGEWSCHSNVEWIKVNNGGLSMTVSVDANDIPHQRVGIIQVNAGKLIKTITVYQSAISCKKKNKYLQSVKYCCYVGIVIILMVIMFSIDWNVLLGKDISSIPNVVKAHIIKGIGKVIVLLGAGIVFIYKYCKRKE